MSLPRDLFHSAMTGAAVIGLTGTMGPFAATISVLGHERKSDAVLRAWAKAILAAAGVRPEARGLEHLPDRECVYVSNHQSHFDVLMIYAHVPRHIRFVAKAELYKIPVFAQSMKYLGNIRVERSGGQKDRETMSEAVEAVKSGRVSLMFFPEGTRSDDGVLRDFKKGAAMLAINAQAPIVPMAVAGTRHVLPKGSAFVRGGRRTAIVVGKPIVTDGLTLADRDSLTHRTRETIAALLAEANEMVGEP